MDATPFNSSGLIVLRITLEHLLMRKWMETERRIHDYD